MDDETWYEVKVISDQMALRPGVWRWWATSRGGFSRPFRHYMDSAIEKAKLDAEAHE